MSINMRIEQCSECRLAYLRQRAINNPPTLLVFIVCLPRCSNSYVDWLCVCCYALKTNKNPMQSGHIIYCALPKEKLPLQGPIIHLSLHVHLCDNWTNDTRPGVQLFLRFAQDLVLCNDNRSLDSVLSQWEGCRGVFLFGKSLEGHCRYIALSEQRKQLAIYFRAPGLNLSFVLVQNVTGLVQIFCKPIKCSE